MAKTGRIRKSYISSVVGEKKFNITLMSTLSETVNKLKPILSMGNIGNAGVRALSKLPPHVAAILATEAMTGENHVRLFCDMDPDVIVLRRSEQPEVFNRVESLRTDIGPNRITEAQTLALIANDCTYERLKELASVRQENPSVNDGVNLTKLAG